MLEQIMTVGFVTAFLTASVRMAVPLIYADSHKQPQTVNNIKDWHYNRHGRCS